MHMMGDYGKTARPDTIALKQNPDGRGPTEDVARLAGARFVNIPEPPKNMVLSAALVKTMTGGDTVTARFLNENSFQYRPQFKLFINTNHLPSVTDTTLFSSGRVKIIPFERHFSEQERDEGLKDFFMEPGRLSAILNWCLDGLWLLRETGFQMPDSVREATEDYRQGSDKTGRFIAVKWWRIRWQRQGRRMFIPAIRSGAVEMAISRRTCRTSKAALPTSPQYDERDRTAAARQTIRSQCLSDIN